MVGNEECLDFLSWAISRGVTDVPRSVVPLSAEHIVASSSACDPRSQLGYSLRIANFPNAGGRGLAASRDLKEGELILRVPKSALMNVLSAKEDPKMGKAIALHPDLSSNQILNVHLLNEIAKGKLSLWYPYLVELPRVHHTMAHFSPLAVQALQVDDAKCVAQKAVGKAVIDWEATKAFMQEIGLRRRFRSLDAWLWASGTVSSRTLHIKWDEAGTLCPFGDLFNYAPPGELYCDFEHLNPWLNGDPNLGEDNTVSDIDDDIRHDGSATRERLQDGGYEEEFDEYCFYARQDYKVGEQVLLCYGLYNNLELLEHYGFSMAQNPNDNVHLTLPDSAEFGSSNDQLPVKSSGGTYIEVDGQPSFSLLAGLRLRAVQAPIRKAKGHKVLMGEQISKESDVLIFQWLGRKCEFLLSCLPTSLEDDLALAKLIGPAQDVTSILALCDRLCQEKDGNGKSMIQHDSKDHAWERIKCELNDIQRAVNSSKDAATVYEGTNTTNDDFQMQRWKLALEWRIGHKRILHRSCLYCAKKIRQLTSRRAHF